MAVILGIKSCVFSDIFTHTHTSIQITLSSVGLNLQQLSSPAAGFKHRTESVLSHEKVDARVPVWT